MKKRNKKPSFLRINADFLKAYYECLGNIKITDEEAMQMAKHNRAVDNKWKRIPYPKILDKIHGRVWEGMHKMHFKNLTKTSSYDYQAKTYSYDYWDRLSSVKPKS